MADGTTVKDAADLTVTIATDEIGGAHYQRVKLDLGADGVSAPVSSTVPVSGTVTATGPLTDTELRASDVKVTLDSEAVAVTGTFWQATQPVSFPSATLVGATGSALVSGTASATTTGDTSIIAAQGSGWFLYITTLIVHNSSATATSVVIKDGSTAKLTIPAPATSGAVVSLPAPLRLSDNAALQFAAAAGVTTMTVSAVGYKAQA